MVAPGWNGADVVARDCLNQNYQLTCVGLQVGYTRSRDALTPCVCILM
jgi:hypothetical protein